jgi:hypothetical protein
MPGEGAAQIHAEDGQGGHDADSDALGDAGDGGERIIPAPARNAGVIDGGSLSSTGHVVNRKDPP